MLSQRLPPESYTGAPLQALQLARALQCRGERVKVFTTLPWGINPDPHCIEGLEVRGLRYPPRLLAKSFWRFAAAYRAAKEIGAAQVVHGHALSPMIIGYALSRSRNSPPFIVKPSLGGRHGEGEIHKLTSSLPMRLVRRALDRVDAFAVLDEDIASDLRAVGVEEARLHRVDNGVDTQRFCPATTPEAAALRRQFGVPADRPMLLYAGQLSPRKGIEELLTAWSRRATAGVPALLALCGGGPLEQRVRQAQAAMPQHVYYLNELADTAPVMRMADVLILPSRHESFGNVVLEAMACGIPVAATETGIAGDVVVDGHSGWRIDAVSVDALDAALHNILDGQVLWQKLGQQARVIAQGYDFAHTAARYQALYAKLISGRS